MRKDDRQNRTRVEATHFFEANVCGVPNEGDEIKVRYKGLNGVFLYAKISYC